MFTSTKLRQVVGIDRAGSFSTAAKVMNISQSTLTKAVADIEKDLGYAVFLRTARGVQATSEGREFLDRAERIVADFDMLIEDAKLKKSDSEVILRIGISPASQEGLYNRIIATLLKERPEICLRVSGLELERGKRMLKRGDIDLLFAPMDEIARELDFTSVSVGAINVMFFCRKGHPILEEKLITAKSLQSYKIVSPDYRTVYAQSVTNVLLKDYVDPMRRMHFIENFALVEQAVTTTDLIGVVSRGYAQTSAFKRRFVALGLDLFQPLELGVARLSRWMPSRAVKACIAVTQRFPPR